MDSNYVEIFDSFFRLSTTILHNYTDLRNQLSFKDTTGYVQVMYERKCFEKKFAYV